MGLDHHAPPVFKMVGSGISLGRPAPSAKRNRLEYHNNKEPSYSTVVDRSITLRGAIDVDDDYTIVVVSKFFEYDERQPRVANLDISLLPSLHVSAR
jgi:hypothetical protein